ncbi:MAG: hypothetical protein WCS17_13465 [Prevotella sp.]
MTHHLFKDVDLGIYFSDSDIPDIRMNDREWQHYFSIIKTKVKPVQTRNRMEIAMAPLVARQFSGGLTSDHETQYERYCKYINSVLSCIRKGGEDYCYFLYQIIDLVKFEPTLSAKYLPEEECFKVTLDKRS